MAVINCLTPAERRKALIALVTSEVEATIREQTRHAERDAQRREVEAQADHYRQILAERHGREFATLEEANDYDDRVWAERIRAKRDEQDKRRQALADELMGRLQMQWTASLLGSTFALGDGTSTTWGAATLEQHERRISMLEINVRGNGEALQRHEAAVIAIMEARATCLDEIL